MLENVTITYCSRVAGYFRGDGLVIRNSLDQRHQHGRHLRHRRPPTSSWRGTSSGGTTSSSSPATTRPRSRSSTSPTASPCRDNLVIEQPYSNGIWYDVGNRDGVFVNNWIEGALVGFFFEISTGATVAGNVFVRCDRGLWVLNSADVRVYNNTFVDTRGVLRAQRAERDGRPLRLASPHGPGRGPARGPRVREQPAGGERGVPQAAAAVRATEGPLREAPAPAGERGRRQRLRARGEASGPLVVWSPVAGESCQVELGSLEELTKLQPGFETRGRSFTGWAGALFRSPELRRLELARAAAGPAARSRACRRRSAACSAGPRRVRSRRAPSRRGAERSRYEETAVPASF